MLERPSSDVCRVFPKSCTVFFRRRLSMLLRNFGVGSAKELMRLSASSGEE